VSILLFCVSCRGQTFIAVLQGSLQSQDDMPVVAALCALDRMLYCLCLAGVIISVLPSVTAVAVLLRAEAELESQNWGLSKFGDEVICTA